MANVYVNEGQRIIYLQDDVNHETISIICNAILKFQSEDEENKKIIIGYKPKEIKLYVNTNGGVVDDTWSLIDLIERSKTPIHTYCTGYAYSSGFSIFISGSKRFISKRAKVMYHQLSCGTRGVCQEMAEDVEAYKKEQELIEQYVAEKTKITKERLKEVREKKLDWYIYSDEAIDLGIADKIL